MRAIGPGSVSSLLKVVLDVVHIALWVTLGVLLVAGVALLVFQPFSTTLAHLKITEVGRGRTIDLAGHTLDFAALFVFVGAYLAVVIVMIGRLRQIFHTLTQGDPFRTENVARLREVGLGLVLLEGLGYLVHIVAGIVYGAHRTLVINLTAWFAILVVFVLAEVFREGARLRDEADLTI